VYLAKLQEREWTYFINSRVTCCCVEVIMLCVTFAGGRSRETKKVGGSWVETPNEEKGSKNEAT